MRFFVAIIALVLFAESTGLVQLSKWIVAPDTFMLANITDAEDSEEKKNGETEGKKFDKNTHSLNFSLSLSIINSQTFYIKNAGLCPKGYGRTPYQPPKI